MVDSNQVNMFLMITNGREYNKKRGFAPLFYFYRTIDKPIPMCYNKYAKKTKYIQSIVYSLFGNNRNLRFCALISVGAFFIFTILKGD